MKRMNVNEYSYLWEEEKRDWVLVNTSYGYCIVNKRAQTALLISDDDLEEAIIDKMLAEGNAVYDDINLAYNDI